MRALAGNVGQQVWAAPGGRKILGVAVPVQRLRAVKGAILVTRDTERMEKAIQSVREDILKVWGVALLVTVALSLYLAGTITRPIRRLAAAAEQVRRGHGSIDSVGSRKRHLANHLGRRGILHVQIAQSLRFNPFPTHEILQSFRGHTQILVHTSYLVV